MKKLNVVIHGCEGVRLDFRERIKKELVGHNVVEFERPRGQFWETFIDTISIDYDHWRLQDDVVLAPDFIDRCLYYETAHPGTVIRGFCQQKDQEEKIMPAASFLWNQCVFWPGKLMKSLKEYALQWIKEKVTATENTGADDYLMRDFLKLNKIKYLMAMPSLVQHAHTESLLGDYCHRVHNKFRQSASFFECYGDV